MTPKKKAPAKAKKKASKKFNPRVTIKANVRHQVSENFTMPARINNMEDALPILSGEATMMIPITLPILTWAKFATILRLKKHDRFQSLITTHIGYEISHLLQLHETVLDQAINILKEKD